VNGLSGATITLIVILGGFVASPVTSLIKHERWPAHVAQIVCMVVSAGVACLAVEIDQPSLFHAANVVSLAGLVFAWATIAYPLVFKTSAAGQRVNAFLTAIGSPRPRGAHAR
jgi:hypothetical protein